jgi:hypothetical protein
MAHLFVALRKIMLKVLQRTFRIILLGRLEFRSFLKELGTLDIKRNTSTKYSYVRPKSNSLCIE